MRLVRTEATSFACECMIVNVTQQMRATGKEMTHTPSPSSKVITCKLLAIARDVYLY